MSKYIGFTLLLALAGLLILSQPARAQISKQEAREDINQMLHAPHGFLPQSGKRIMGLVEKAVAHPEPYLDVIRERSVIVDTVGGRRVQYFYPFFGLLLKISNEEARQMLRRAYLEAAPLSDSLSIVRKELVESGAGYQEIKSFDVLGTLQQIQMIALDALKALGDASLLEETRARYIAVADKPLPRGNADYIKSFLADYILSVGGTLPEEDDSPPVNENADIRPVLICVADTAGGALTAHFGYENRYGQPVTIPYGASNQLTPAAYQEQQPKVFYMPAEDSLEQSVGQLINLLQFTIQQAQEEEWADPALLAALDQQLDAAEQDLAAGNLAPAVQQLIDVLDQIAQYAEDAGADPALIASFNQTLETAQQHLNDERLVLSTWQLIDLLAAVVQQAEQGEWIDDEALIAALHQHIEGVRQPLTRRAFTLTFGAGEEVSWTLSGRTATAPADAISCSGNDGGDEEDGDDGEEESDNEEEDDDDEGEEDGDG